MLSETIKKERNKKGLSQMDFSKVLGVSQQTIGSWETGRTSPDTEMVKKIAQYFGVSTDYLLGNDANINQNNANQPKSYIALHRLIDKLPENDVEELLNTAKYKQQKIQGIKKQVEDTDDF